MLVFISLWITNFYGCQDQFKHQGHSRDFSLIRKIIKSWWISRFSYIDRVLFIHNLKFKDWQSPRISWIASGIFAIIFKCLFSLWGGGHDDIEWQWWAVRWVGNCILLRFSRCEFDWFDIKYCIFKYFIGTFLSQQVVWLFLVFWQSIKIYYIWQGSTLISILDCALMRENMHFQIQCMKIMIVFFPIVFVPTYA